MMSSPATNWRDSVSSDLRLHLIHKCVQAIVPGTQKSALNEPRLVSVVTYARDIENCIYEKAVSRSDYYHMLAQKIYELTRELERRKDDKTFEDITNKMKNL
ncbi:hypothetical protein O0L34_g12152 [Tuta absoluta]|nr:hypothetical protein O0L34_g12152 [Tuta absoluta]